MSRRTPAFNDDAIGTFEGAPARQGRALRSGLVAGLMVAVAVAMTLGAAPGLAGPWAGGDQIQDTLRNQALRCLSSRPGDCLDEPVSTSEPHKGVCATCHNLWDRSVPANVTRSCTSAGCHSGEQSLSAFHNTVHPEALQDCVHCHQAHDFRIPESGDDCSACHVSGGLPVEWADATWTHGLRAPTAFRHQDHSAVDCARCHGTQDGHGTLTVVSIQDCRSCHHRPPVSNNCVTCHAPATDKGHVLNVTRSLNIRIGSLDRPLRIIPFDHGYHVGIACADCHTRGSELRAAAGADCSGCHLEHHEATADCSNCHQKPADGAHGPEVHLGCSGVGCHDPIPPGVKMAPRTRNLCLACHTEQVDHMVGKECATCHLLPEPTGVGRSP